MDPKSFIFIYANKQSILSKSSTLLSTTAGERRRHRTDKWICLRGTLSKNQLPYSKARSRVFCNQTVREDVAIMDAHVFDEDSRKRQIGGRRARFWFWIDVGENRWSQRRYFQERRDFLALFIESWRAIGAGILAELHRRSQTDKFSYYPRSSQSTAEKSDLMSQRGVDWGRRTADFNSISTILRVLNRGLRSEHF